MQKDLFSTSRITGLLYLGLALTGMFAFLFAKSKLYVEGDAVATTTNLISNQSLARMGLSAELALVGFQALVAVWFFKLFKKTDMFAAISLTVFGLVNAVAILISNAFWLAALLLALENPDIANNANQVLVLFNLHEVIWIVSKLFFGLWLIPMGYLAGLAKMPRFLGWFLIGGGVGYILSAFMSILTPGLADVNELITIPATIGEFWMIGYLLFKKVTATGK